MMEAKHVFKCPGDAKRNGIRYNVKSVSSQEELDLALETGWSETLAEAALKAGPIALVIPKKVSDKQKARWKKLAGNPATYPTQETLEEAVSSLNEESSEEEAPIVEEIEESEPIDQEIIREIIEVEEKAEEADSDDTEPKPFIKYEDLTDTDKMDVVELLREGSKSNSEIGKLFNIHHFTVAKIKKELM